MISRESCKSFVLKTSFNTFGPYFKNIRTSGLGPLLFVIEDYYTLILPAPCYVYRGHQRVSTGSVEGINTCYDLTVCCSRFAFNSFRKATIIKRLLEASTLNDYLKTYSFFHVFAISSSACPRFPGAAVLSFSVFASTTIISLQSLIHSHPNPEPNIFPWTSQSQSY